MANMIIFSHQPQMSGHGRAREGGTVTSPIETGKPSLFTKSDVGTDYCFSSPSIAVESRAITFICRFRARDDSRVERRRDIIVRNKSGVNRSPFRFRPSRLILHVRVTNICFPTTTSKERSGGGDDDLPNQTPAVHLINMIRR